MCVLNSSRVVVSTAVTIDRVASLHTIYYVYICVCVHSNVIIITVVYVRRLVNERAGARPMCIYIYVYVRVCVGFINFYE